MMLLRTVRPDLAGAEAVVLGRSKIVGRPMAALLLAADCTVTMVHSKTRDPAAVPARRHPGRGDWAAANGQAPSGSSRVRR